MVIGDSPTDCDVVGDDDDSSVKLSATIVIDACNSK